MSSALKESFIIENRTRFLQATENAKSASLAIDSLLELPEGWHYGEGRGAARGAADTAREIDACFLRLDVRAIEVFPCLDGGILVCGRHKNEDVEVLCHQDGRLIDLCHEINDDPVHEESDITFQQAARYLEELSWEKKSSDWFTQDISAKTREGLKAKLSKIRMMVAGPLYFAQSAHGRSVDQNVVMLSISTTQKPLARHQFYGGSARTKYQTKVLSGRIRQKHTRAI